MCVEGDPRVASALERSATRLTPDGGVHVRRSRLPAGLAKLGEEEPFDLVFADPPYAFEAWEALLDALMGRVAADGEVAVEHACRVDLPDAAADLERVASRRYGDSCLSFYRPTGTESPAD